MNRQYSLNNKENQSKNRSRPGSAKQKQPLNRQSSQRESKLSKNRLNSARSGKNSQRSSVRE